MAYPTSGPPASGTWTAGQAVADQDNTAWVCTIGGTPGTWVQIDWLNLVSTNRQWKNYLQNGGLEYWSYFSSVADQWVTQPGSGSTITVSKETVNKDTQGTACAKIVYTHSAESFYRQDILNYTEFIGSTVTVSVRVKTSTPNAVRAFISTGISVVFGDYHSGSGNYETLSMTWTVNQTSTRVRVGIALDASCTAYFDNAILVPGSIASNFVPPSMIDNSGIVPLDYISSDNLLLNGGFETWQLGSGPFTANGATFADGWAITMIGASTVSISQDSVNADSGSQYCAAIAYVQGSNSYIRQMITGPTTGQLIGRTYTFSARIKSSVAGAVQLRIIDSTTNQASTSPSHSGSGLYETLYVTRTIGAGSTGFQIQLLLNATGTFYIDNATLTNGTLPISYTPPRSPDIELVPPSYFVGLNLLTNPGMEIWQRGNGPFTTNAARGPDFWFIQLQGSSTVSVTKETINVDTGSKAAASIAYTHVSGGGMQLVQRFENPIQYAGLTITFSIRIKSSSQGCHLDIQEGPSNGATASSNYSGSGQFETLTVTRTLGSAPSYVQVFVAFNGTGVYYLDNATVVVGSAPAPYVPLLPSEEWNRCLRYYERIGGSDSGSANYGSVFRFVSTAASQTLSQIFFYKALKAVQPIVTINGTWLVSLCGQWSNEDLQSLEIMAANVVTTGAGNGYIYSDSNTKFFSAEANP